MRVKIPIALLVACLFVGIAVNWARVHRQTAPALAATAAGPPVPVAKSGGKDDGTTSRPTGAVARDEAKPEDRAAYLRKWMVEDRDGLFRFMKQDRYRDLALPGVPKMLVRYFTAGDLLDLANGADEPAVIMDAMGRDLNPKVLVDFSRSLNQVAEAQKKPIALEVGDLLAGVNFDAAINFARNAPDDALRAQAYAGILDQLKTTSNGTVEAKAVYAGLPPAIRDTDIVRFAYGLVTWGDDPTSALATISGMADPMQRKVVMVTLANQSANIAPEVAISAFYQSGLSDNGVVTKVTSVHATWAAVDPQAVAAYLKSATWIPPGDLNAYQKVIPPLPNPPSGP